MHYTYSYFRSHTTINNHSSSKMYNILKTDLLIVLTTLSETNIL